MGQQICYIISPDDVQVPLEIVHFKEQDCTVFPLLVTDTDYENILNYSEPENSEEFFHEFMIHCGYEYLNRRVADFMSEKKLQNFAMINYGNFSSIGDSFPLLFIDGQCNSLPWENFENESHRKLGIAFTFLELIRNEAKYRSFLDAEDYYFRELEKFIDNSYRTLGGNGLHAR